jgi:adenosylcobinamide-phosphate synthase
MVFDRVVREPRTEFHPVAWFGSAMGRVESMVWRDRRSAGVVYAATGVGIGAAVGIVARSGAGLVGDIAVTAVAIAGSELRRTAGGVACLLDSGDLAAARVALRSLAGRDASALDESGVAAAVIESLGENTVDATVATIAWAFAGGAIGAAAHRASNTMDAMVGHHSARYERFGWSAARLDDVMAWVPARLFVGLVALVRPARVRDIVRVVRRDAPAHPSPNAGVAEAAVAAALGLQLGGELRYGDRVEIRPTLGDGPRPVATDIGRAVRLIDDVERAVLCLLVAAAAVGAVMAGRASPRAAAGVFG